MTELLATHTLEEQDAAVERSARLLTAGELVALPTETVYGLAANAFDSEAVARIFEVKGRPPTNPIIVHVASLEMARQCVSHWPTLADKLAQAFWPGPLTLVLEKSALIPDIVTAGGNTVGIRWPSHPFIQSVIKKCGFPLAAPSANPSNEISPTTADHVYRTLGGKIPLVVDGGPSRVGIESTVLDLTANPPRVLRPGMVHSEALLAVLGRRGLELGGGSPSHSHPVLRSPGMLKRHYAPKARLLILKWADDADLRQQLSAATSSFGVALTVCHVIAHTKVPSGGFGRISVLPHEPAAYARSLYAELHRSDSEAAAFIVVEAPPASEEWRAISDRLARASASAA